MNRQNEWKGFDWQTRQRQEWLAKLAAEMQDQEALHGDAVKTVLLSSSTHRGLRQAARKILACSAFFLQLIRC